MTRDLWHALRTLRREPGFGLLTVLTLALGCGAAVAVFSVFDAVVLRPLPYPEPGQLVAVWERSDRDGRMHLSTPDFEDWREASGRLRELAVWSGGPAAVGSGASSRFADAYMVSSGFFAVMGVAPAAGRVFDPAWRPGGAPPVAVVSHAFWRDALAARPLDELGPLRIAGTSLQVIGVMPEGFGFPRGAALWVPRELVPDGSTRTAHNWSAVARLAPGATASDAAEELSAVARRIRTAHPGQADAAGAFVRPLREELAGDARRPLLLLLAAVALLLLATCASAGQALVARGLARRRALAVRAALGADGAALLRMLLSECLVLAAAAGALGLLAGRGLASSLVATAPELLPRDVRPGLDLRLVAFAGAAALVSTLLAGLLPAWRLATRPDLRDALASGDRGSAPAGGRLRRLLVAAEAAVAVLLLAGSALLLRSLIALGAVEPGFEPRAAQIADVAMPDALAADPPGAARLHQRLLERLDALPGVARAGMTSALPMSGSNASGTLELAGGTRAQADYRVVSGGYFEAAGIPLLRGRVFESHDGPEGDVVAVVNRRMAEQSWPGLDPLGQRVRFLGMDSLDEPWMRVVGVVGDVRHEGPADEMRPAVYVDFRQRPLRTTYPTVLVVRARPGAGPTPEALTSALHAVEPMLPVRIRPLAALVDDALAQRRFGLRLAAAFALVALALAAAGTWGALARSVAARRREIGVRVALGARPSDVVHLVLREGLLPVLQGAAAGVLLALAAGRALAASLHGVGAADPASHAAAVLLVMGAAIAASVVPARAATRLDPIETMRAD